MADEDATLVNSYGDAERVQLDGTHLAAWRGFITAHARLIDRIDRDLASAGVIPLHWYDVLIELYEAPGRRLRLHELAEAVVLSRSGLTRLVDRLEGAGLLARQPNPDDRRSTYAALTDAGHMALRQAWPHYARGISAHFARHLDDQQAQILVGAFGRMLNEGEQHPEVARASEGTT